MYVGGGKTWNLHKTSSICGVLSKGRMERTAKAPQCRQYDSEMICADCMCRVEEYSFACIPCLAKTRKGKTIDAEVALPPEVETVLRSRLG